MVALRWAIPLLLVAAPLGAGYHIRDAIGTPGLQDPTEWIAGAVVIAPVTDPENPPLFYAGDILVAALACETNGDNTLLPSLSGVGGLCFMSPGFTAAGGCAFVGGATDNGNSNGLTDACVAAAPGPATPTPLLYHAPYILTAGSASATPKWYEFRMQDQADAAPGTGHDLPFLGLLAGVACPFSGQHLIVDALFADLVSGGHVTGIPVVQSLPGPGGYSVRASAGPGAFDTRCDTAGDFYVG